MADKKVHPLTQEEQDAYNNNTAVESTEEAKNAVVVPVSQEALKQNDRIVSGERITESPTSLPLPK